MISTKFFSAGDAWHLPTFPPPNWFALSAIEGGYPSPPPQTWSGGFPRRRLFVALRSAPVPDCLPRSALWSFGPETVVRPTHTLVAISSSLTPASAASKICARLSLRAACLPPLRRILSSARSVWLISTHIQLYTRLHRRPPAETDMQQIFSHQPAFGSPNGADARTGRIHPTPGARGSQHRNAH
jgi:hypothetical protein